MPRGALQWNLSLTSVECEGGNLLRDAVAFEGLKYVNFIKIRISIIEIRIQIHPDFHSKMIIF